MSEPVTRKAHAKLNVFLRVLGRRGDGYHDIETVILPLDLHDLVTVEPGFGLDVVVTGPRAGDLAGAGGESLVTAAAAAWASAAGRDEPGVRITLDKRIPVAAGLGGGSADAAATLRALEACFATGLSVADLRMIGAELGSDVPALLLEEPAYAHGRGDRVTPVHAVTTHWVVVPARFPVAVADAYTWWDESGTTGHDPGMLVAALETGNTAVLGPSLFDDLQGPVAAHHPEIAATIAALEEAGALGAIMTGSGPTVVALARHLGHADELAASVPGSFVAAGPPRTMSTPSGVV